MCVSEREIKYVCKREILDFNVLLTALGLLRTNHTIKTRPDPVDSQVSHQTTSKKQAQTRLTQSIANSSQLVL